MLEQLLADESDNLATANADAQDAEIVSCYTFSDAEDPRPEAAAPAGGRPNPDNDLDDYLRWIKTNPAPVPPPPPTKKAGGQWRWSSR